SLSAADVKYTSLAAASVGAFLRHGEVGQAKGWLDMLAEREPDSLQTLELRVRLLKAMYQAPAAAKLVRNYLQKPNANIQAAGRLFEEISRADLAEETYRKWVGQTSEPNRWFVFAKFLGRNDRVDEALDFCERAAKAGNNRASGVGVDVLTSA